MSLRRLSRLRALCLFAISFLSASPVLAATQWYPFGPEGGDARALAADPQDYLHVYAGTVNGTLYDTHDGGHSWKRLSRVGQRDDLVIDNVLVDPADSKHLLVGAWVVEHPDGGFYTSHDGGLTWEQNPQMKGHSIRSMTRAPSNPHILVAGALDGVFRSEDQGQTWRLISPPGSTEIHEVQSVAIDPKDPQIIYAGTWHLPWKTTDGGKNWENIKQGVIDDSDVFSIIIDPTKPQTVYASACSGIYKSEDAGAQFSKLQGIPSTARRTRVLMQDPKDPNVVFAGTTEGLFRTSDAGKTWLRYGSADLVVNGIYIDPNNPKHMLLSTDHIGLLMSDDGGFQFEPSNRGFYARQIAAFLQASGDESYILVGVLNDKEAGGVFASRNGGLSWQQDSDGLQGADVFALGRSPDGVMLAGTRHGIYRLENDHWVSSGLKLVQEKPVAPTGRRSTAHNKAHNKRTARMSSRSAAPRGRAPARHYTTADSDAGVYAIVSNANTVFAATDAGLLASQDGGTKWEKIDSVGGKPWRMLATNGDKLFAANIDSLALSVDQGKTFRSLALPNGLTLVSAIAVDGAGRVWAGGREGVYYSEDGGSDWKSLKDLFVPNVSGISYDAKGNRLLVTQHGPSTVAFGLDLATMKVQHWDPGWNLRLLRPVGDHLVGVTAFDGVVVQPRMVESAFGPDTPAKSVPAQAAHAKNGGVQ